MILCLIVRECSLSCKIISLLTPAIADIFGPVRASRDHGGGAQQPEKAPANEHLIPPVVYRLRRT